MALVPYRVSGPAADQRAAERLLQLPGGISLRLMQCPAASGAAAPRPGVASDADAASAAGPQPPKHRRLSEAGRSDDEQQRQGLPLSSLVNVGLVVWQAGFLLADFLLRRAPDCSRPPRGQRGGGGAAADWRYLTVVDLGTGSGVVGIALALAGARVVLTDLPHVVPLAAANVAANCDPRVTRAVVCAYRWGDDPGAAAAAAPEASQAAAAEGGGGADGLAPPSPLAGVAPDVITAADVLYHENLLQPLMTALVRLSAPHTVSYVSYRVRHGGEVAAFLALAEAAGFAAAEVPDAELHEEYRSGGGSGGGGGGRFGCRTDGGGVEDGMMDDASDEEEDGERLAVECGGGDRRRPPGAYGILRLCRRDCTALLPPPPGVTTGSAAAAATATAVAAAAAAAAATAGPGSSDAWMH